jgi:hypothetical protein
MDPWNVIKMYVMYVCMYVISLNPLQAMLGLYLKLGYSISPFINHPSNHSMLNELLISKTAIIPSTFKTLNIRRCQTTICPYVLYGYETWSLSSTEEHKLQGCENKGPRKKSACKNLIKLALPVRDEKLTNTNMSPGVVLTVTSRWIRRAGHVAGIGKIRNACRIFFTKTERRGRVGSTTASYSRGTVFKSRPAYRLS